MVRKLKNTPFADLLSLMVNWAKALRGETASPTLLSDASFNEEAFVETYGAKPFFMLSRNLARLHLCYSFGEFNTAVPIARTMRRSAPSLIGNIRTVLFQFWSALALAENYTQASEAERGDDLAQMQDARRAFEVLARSCPENFLCKSLLLSAEIERVTGDQYAAEGSFERAISYANETNMVQHQAIANELYGAFWLRRGNRKIAAVYMREAHEHYARWGAGAKARHLAERYRELLEFLQSAPNEPVPAIGRETLDLSTIIKAAHAVSRNIELEEFLKELLRIAIENAGARKGALIEERDGRLFAVAHGTADAGDVAFLQDTAIGPETP